MTSGETFLLDLVKRELLEIRDDGTVWRHFTYSRTGAIKAISPVRADHATAKGYRFVCVRLRKIAYRAMAHRLVWMASNGPIPDGHEINHKDGIRDNNKEANLEPLTHGQNQLHSYRHLHRFRAAGVLNGYSKLTTEQVGQIRTRKGLSTSRAVGREFGVSHFAIQRIWNGSGWRHCSAMPEVRHG